MIIVNLDKAKAITKDNLRAERAPLLASLDVAFQRNLELGADNAEVIAEKQRLRDITKVVDTVETVEELKALSCEKPVAVEPVVEPVEEPTAEGV